MKFILKTFLTIFLFFTISLTACNCGSDTVSSDPGDGSDDGDGDGFGFFDEDSSDGSEEDDSGSISELPEGVALSATLNGESIQISDDNVTGVALRDEVADGADFDDNVDTIDTGDLPLTITLYCRGTESADILNIGLDLNTDNVTSTLSIGTTYTLSGSDLGSVYLRSTDGTATTFTIQSALISFTTLEVTDDGDLAGSLQLGFSDSADTLTANFNGQFSVVGRDIF